MKKDLLIKSMLFLLAFVIFPISIFATGGVSVSKSSLTIDEGGTATFTITASSAAGKVTITSKDTSIATVNKSSEWLENETLKVTVTGVKEGTTSIVVHTDDMATFDEEEVNVTKTISVKVSGPKSTVNTLSDLKINGSTVSGFSLSTTSYSYSTEDDSVEISATKTDDKSTVSGTGTKKLKYGSNKFSIKVTAESGSVKTYTVTVNKKDDRNTNNNLKDLKIDGVTLSG